MSDTILIANSGRTTGSAASRRLRREDQVPGVLYGLGMEPLALSVERSELRQALSGPAGINTVLDLNVDGTVYPAIVKELQRHPVRQTVSHVDFIQINLAAEITVNVPVRLEGEAEAVMREGGLVDPAVDHLEVVTTPRNIPDEIVIDISEMTMDTVIRLEDIALPEGVTPTAEPDTALVTALYMRQEPEPEAAEGEEGEAAAEGEDGAAAEAEGGDGGDGGGDADASSDGE